MHKDFLSFVQSDVLPKQSANPSHIRLDGEKTGGNREIAGQFQHHNTHWVVHADTHYEPLHIAYDAALAGVDPFDELDTKTGRCLVLKQELRAKQKSRHKHLYIYSTGKG